MPTDYRAFYDKDFIGAWDIQGKDMVITITRCKAGELTAPGGKKSKKPVVYFQGSEKGFALNATNGKTIAALYGNYVEEWAGKKIALYKSMTRNPQDGGEIECLRVRPQIPAAQGKPSAADHTPPTDEEPAAAGTDRSAERLKDADAIKAAFNDTELLGIFTDLYKSAKGDNERRAWLVKQKDAQKTVLNGPQSMPDIDPARPFDGMTDDVPK